MAGTGELVERVRRALELPDPAALRELLDPDVHWGAADALAAECTNRDQVLAWWTRAHDSGVTAQVTEVTAGERALLVGLRVHGRETTGMAGGEERWQVLTVRDGRVFDIRGFDDRDAAAERAGVAG